MSAADSFSPADPLERSLRPERVNYAAGVLLQADDFRDEQTYHRGRLAAALRGLVGFGTVAGLRVRPPAAEDNELELRVDPGLAVDRHGRLMELDAPWCIRLSRWFAAQETATLRAAVHRAPRVDFEAAVVADLFLGAHDCGRGKTPSFASGPFDALDALTHARVAEEPRLTLVLRAENEIPVPRNFWPAPDASREERLAAVLGAWEDDRADGLEPLAEHVDGEDASAVLLARIAIAVTLAPDAPSGARPVLDLAQRTQADNSLRPFISLTGKWLGRAPAIAPLIEPGMEPSDDPA